MSDVVPVLSLGGWVAGRLGGWAAGRLGGWAAHLPYRMTCSLEHAELVQHDRRLTVTLLADVPPLLGAG